MPVASSWRFEDEWLVKAVESMAGLDAAAVERLRQDREPQLAQALLGKGLLTFEQLADVIEARFNLGAERDLPRMGDRLALSLVPESFCRARRVVPLRVTENFLDVAMVNPLDAAAIGDLEAIAGRSVRPRFALAGETAACLDRIFNQDSVVYDLLKKIGSAEDVELVGERSGEDGGESVRAPVVQLVNSIIVHAIRRRASDVHIEHDEQTSHVRYRIDGVLTGIMNLPRRLASGPVVARVKIMANLDVANHLRPQDGRAKLRVGGNEIGLRVSSLPTAFGEKVVLRILDKRAAQVPLDQLGFPSDVVGAVEGFLAASQGIVLVTGPTGSGKTTTLYSMLNKCRSESTNIVSIEDPIEYRLEGINQVQINEKQGLGFSAVLRSVLRQDPDVIMVGEIRDRETADIAFQAAMTGHLVFSTLHTNDTVSTLSRLIDMGVDRFKITPGLLAVTAQRLVRRLCASCRKPVPRAELPAWLAGALAGAGFTARAWKAGGCARCAGAGYQGRIALIELLTVGEGIRALVNSGAPDTAVRAAASASGLLRTLTRDALGHIAEGDVDVAEAAPYLSLQTAVGAEAGAAPRRPALVMIVDDDEETRALLRRAVEGAACEAIEASDGEVALNLLSKVQPNLILLDLNMPKVGGLEVLRTVREDLALADLPIMVITAEKDDASQELALKLGADDYVAKPFRSGVIRARVQAALRRAGRT